MGGGGGSTSRPDQEMCVMHFKISSFCRQSLSVTSVYYIMLGISFIFACSVVSLGSMRGDPSKAGFPTVNMVRLACILHY